MIADVSPTGSRESHQFQKQRFLGHIGKIGMLRAYPKSGLRVWRRVDFLVFWPRRREPAPFSDRL